MPRSRGQTRTTSRRFGPHTTGTTKSFSSASITTFPNTSQRSDTSVHGHLVHTQKQTNLTNSLLQDITVSSEYDPTKLEDWLKDIETAADQTSES